MQQTPAPAYLIIHLGNRWSDILRLVAPQTVTIGRASSCQVVVRDDRVSRHHAEVFGSSEGWSIRDLGSRNGTLVNSERIGEERRLNNGDVIQVGRCLMTFVTHLGGAIRCPVALPETTGSQRTVGGSQTIVSRKSHSQWSAPAWGKPRSTSSVASADTDSPWVFFYQLVAELVQVQRPAEAAEIALQRLVERLGIRAGGVLLFNSPSSNDKPPSWRVLAHRTAQGGAYRTASDELLETVLREGQAVLARNVTTDVGQEIAQASDMREVSSIICAPLRRLDGNSSKARGASPSSKRGSSSEKSAEVVGVLHLYSAVGEPTLTPADLELVVGVADNLAIALERQAEQVKLTKTLERTRRQVDALREQLDATATMVGRSPAMEQVRRAIQRAAPSTATVLIRGESGVGKELVARALHDASNRRSGPMLCLNCAALAPTLLESELFGHEKGAFTGATERKLGKFEAADGGTLFLDEIGEMPLELQAKLLRVLEGQPFERLGGHKSIRCDVRVIAATNRDLEAAVQEKQFRADLYYRLRVVEIDVPPLRQRKEDIEELAAYFIRKFAPHANRRLDGLAPKTLQILMAHDWPGNVRELRNVIERAVVLGTSNWISPDDLNISSLRQEGTRTAVDDDGTCPFDPLPLSELERRHILATLQFVGGNKSKAAQLLGIERSTLDRKLKKYRSLSN
ncbi:MAG: sigma-54-dependent Fis family transcriptional regulator [Pirellulaceae bacterium]|nr:MAG: sigma-54-dependent Fis family transcriptional regulator [Pirellulaceae bacterium]